MTGFVTRAATPEDREPVARLLASSWGATTVVVHGTAYDAADLPAVVAERDGRLAGVLTYHCDDSGLELVTINATVPRSGVGTALLDAAVDIARRSGLERVWLVTANDNLDALRFYQRRGLRITAVSPGAVDRARAVKPAIPLVGQHGIELHDELTLELRL